MARRDDEDAEMLEIDASDDVLPEEATDEDISERAAQLAEEPFFDQDAFDAVSQMDPFGKLGQALGIEQIVPAQPEPIMLDPAPPIVEGEVDPATGMPAAAAPIVEAPVAPVMVPQKQGSIGTITNQQIESAESRRLGGELQENKQELKEVTAAEIKANEDEARILADQAEKEARTAREVDNHIIAVQQAGLEQYQREMQEKKVLAVEYANMKPEKFWDSKSTADKIASAVSIGLGSFGAALTGSGRNIGQVMLEREMNEFDRAQKQKFEAKLKQIEMKDLSAKEKLFLANQQKLVLEAVKIGELNQIKSLHMRQLQMAKTAKVAAGIQQRMIGIENQIIQTEMTQAARLEKDIKSTEQRDVIKLVAQQNSKAGIKEKEERVSELGKTVTKLSPIRSEIASALKQLNSSKLSEEDKIRIGQGLVKTLNSTQGSDAVGAEEAQRLAAELETSFGGLATGVAKGAAAGATIGGAAAAVPTLGLGTPVGIAGGGVLGGILGGGIAAADQLSKPGGIRFSPDIGGFTRRVQGVLDKLDGTINRQSAIQDLVRQGWTIPQANAYLDKQEAGQ